MSTVLDRRNAIAQCKAIKDRQGNLDELQNAYDIAWLLAYVNQLEEERDEAFAHLLNIPERYMTDSLTELTRDWKDERLTRGS